MLFGAAVQLGQLCPVTILHLPPFALGLKVDHEGGGMIAGAVRIAVLALAVFVTDAGRLAVPLDLGCGRPHVLRRLPVYALLGIAPVIDAGLMAVPLQGSILMLRPRLALRLQGGGAFGRGVLLLLPETLACQLPQPLG